MNMLEKLRRLMAEHNHAQAFVESAAGLPKNRITKWLAGQGEPTASQALRLATLYGVDLAALVDPRFAWPPASAGGPKTAAILEVVRQLGEDIALARLVQAAHEKAGTALPGGWRAAGSNEESDDPQPYHERPKKQGTPRRIG